MFKTDNLNCFECGWTGQIEECGREKQWSEWAGGCWVAIPVCPKCESEHLADYDSQEAKDARLMFTGNEGSPETPPPSEAINP